jgi:hypothetical protein
MYGSRKERKAINQRQTAREEAVKSRDVVYGLVV